MRDDNEPLFELSMGRGPSLNEQYAKIEVQQQALQQEIDQGLHEPAIAKGMQPIRDKMEEDSSFEGLSEAEKNALARYAAEELLVYGAPNVKITDAYINPNDGEVEFEINGFTLVNFAPETAYNKFMPDVTESVPSITQPLEKTPETNPLEANPLETNPLEMNPLEMNPLETNPLETNPLETNPLETNPLETNPLEAPAPEPQTSEPQTLQERVEAVNQTIAEIEALNTDMEHMTPKEFDEFIRSERSAELFNPESLAEIKSELDSIQPSLEKTDPHFSLSEEEEKKGWLQNAIDHYVYSLELRGQINQRMAENAVDALTTTAALTETIGLGLVNTITKGSVSTGSIPLFAAEWVITGDYEKGVDAYRAAYEPLAEQLRIETSKWSQGQLSEGVIADIGQALQEKGHSALVAIEEKYGSAVAGFAKDALTTTMEATGIIGAGAIVKNTLRMSTKTPPTHIYLKSNDISKIFESGRIWGQTEGSVYGMKMPNPALWRTMIDRKNVDGGLIALEGGAAALFKPHEAIGIFSGYKRLAGQHKAPFGDIEFDVPTATFDAVKNQLTIRHASIKTHAERNIFTHKFFEYLPKRLFPRGGRPVSEEAFSAYAATRLWGRRSMEIGITFGIGKTVEWMTRDPFKDLDLNFTTPQKKEKE